MDDLSSQMILFAQVVEHGSLSAAARMLNVSPSAVSKQMRRLEDRIGVRLLNRSTRQDTLTEEGRAFYERCASLAREVADAEAMATSMGGHVSGRLHVASTVAFGKTRILPLVADFLEAWPDLRLVLELTDRKVDLAQEDVDISIRLSRQLDDHSLVARRLLSNTRVLCAAPIYLQRHGTPQNITDLAQHNCLRVYTVSSWNDWRFESEHGPQLVRVTGNFEASSADAVYGAAMGGLGIARLSTYLIGDDLKAGRLIQVLPEHKGEQDDIYAVYSERRNLSPRIKVFVDFLMQRLTGKSPPLV